MSETENNIPGRRVDGEPSALQSGDYGKAPDGIWHCVPPGRELHAFLGNLSEHTITEHEDGTITAKEIIEIGMPRAAWRGYLERGVWRHDVEVEKPVTPSDAPRPE